MIPEDILKIIHNKTLGSKELTLKLLKLTTNMNRDTIIEIFEYAAIANPTMPMLKNILEEIRTEQADPKQLITKLVNLNIQIANNLKKLLTQETSIVTFSRSQTVLEVIKHLHKEGYIKTIYVSEARPTQEGIKLAEELTKEGVEVTLCIDIYLPEQIQKADKVIIGCDAILPDNSIINKVGSKTLAIVAKHYKKDFIVIGDEYKYTEPTKVEFKHGPVNEIYTGDIGNIRVINPYFETVPKDLITYIITNKGIIKVK